MDYYTIQAHCFVCKVEDKLGQERGAQSHPINCGWRIERERAGYVKGLEDIIKLCNLPKDMDPSEVIEKIKNTAVCAAYGRYDIEIGR